MTVTIFKTTEAGTTVTHDGDSAVRWNGCVLLFREKKANRCFELENVSSISYDSAEIMHSNRAIEKAQGRDADLLEEPVGSVGILFE